jgi:hypothetical protein
MAADAAVFFGLWLLPESLGAAPRRCSALARGLVRAGCPLERIIAVEGNAARIGQYLAGHIDGCPPLRVFTAVRHARMAKGCKNCVKDFSENDDPLRAWAAARCSRLPWQPPSYCCTRTRKANPPTTSAARTGGCHPLRELPPMRMTPLTRIWMVALRGYLVVAGGLVLVRIISWQPQSTAETRCRHRSRQMAKTSHDIQNGIWTTVGSEKQLSARRA